MMQVLPTPLSPKKMILWVRLPTLELLECDIINPINQYQNPIPLSLSFNIIKNPIFQNSLLNSDNSIIDEEVYS